jgi:hypothetical protein
MTSSVIRALKDQVFPDLVVLKTFFPVSEGSLRIFSDLAVDVVPEAGRRRELTFVTTYPLASWKPPLEQKPK